MEGWRWGQEYLKSSNGSPAPNISRASITNQGSDLIVPIEAGPRIQARSEIQAATCSGLLITWGSIDSRVANRPGMAGIVPELTHGVPCPGRGSFCPGNVKIDHRTWIWLFTKECIVFCIVFVSHTRLDLT